MAVTNLFVLSVLVILLASVSAATKSEKEAFFLRCFYSYLNHSKPIPEVILIKNSSAYSSILQSSIRNLRFFNNSRTEPEFIITPLNESHVQATVSCAKNHDMQVRLRSGGHDYEGLSYASDEQFVLIDLANLRSIDVDIENGTAWVESGATLGELYYKIEEKSSLYGFPAGSCPTVGVGGHFSGGGFGTIFRKYGLAADQVTDAKIVDVNGKILDRKSMGENLFWAIRGGGGASFGVIISWKVRLVSVPPTVTVFGVDKTIDQGASKLLQKWQTISHKLHEDLFLHAVLQASDSTSNKNRTVHVSFDALFLGGVDQLLSLIQDSFPEFSLTRNNCSEMSWIQSVLYFAGFPTNGSLNVLLDRKAETPSFFKAKSDFIQKPIPETGLDGLYKILAQNEATTLILTPYGGKMSEISNLETPFPHRRGNLYQIQYLVYWDVEEETEKYLNWMRRLYAYMTPYASKSPRAAYLNYRDLDLGRNNNHNRNTSLGQASIWGLKYFRTNFKRLVQVKTSVDPCNFFRNEQSIPVLL